MDKVQILTQAPAGRYIVGDPCYVVGDGDWDELITDWIDNGGRDFTGQLPDGRLVWAVSTKYGDGQYSDQHGRRYGVDAGMIGVVTLPESAARRELGDLNHIVTFDKPFTVTVDDDGVIRIGELVIPTGDESDF